MLVALLLDSQAVWSSVQIVPAGTTPTYLAVIDAAGDLIAGVADTSLLSNTSTAMRLSEASASAAAAAAVAVMDGNVPNGVFTAVCYACSANQTPLLFEPTSCEKALLPVKLQLLHQIAVITPNIEVSSRMYPCALRCVHMTH